MDKHSFPNGKRLVRDTLKPDDNLHYEKFSGGTVKCIEDEIPFDVPNNWEWCRFGSYTLNRDSERKPVSSVQRKKVKKFMITMVHQELLTKQIVSYLMKNCY